METKRKVELTIEYLEQLPVPSKMKQDVLYVLKNRNIVSHKCLCGCDRVINLPIDKNGWTFRDDFGKATMTPSVLNHPCECHYIITNGVANIV